jgi:hypothetical protein
MTFSIFDCRFSITERNDYRAALTLARKRKDPVPDNVCFSAQQCVGGMIRQCGQTDVAAVFEIINDAAQAYKGIIPADRWHDPYMPLEEIQHELGAGDTRAAGRRPPQFPFS